MSIVVLPPVQPSKTMYFTISHEESELIKKNYIAFGKVPAIRLTRAFAKCDLASAVEYVNSIKE